MKQRLPILLFALGTGILLISIGSVSARHQVQAAELAAAQTAVADVTDTPTSTITSTPTETPPPSPTITETSVPEVTPSGMPTETPTPVPPRAGGPSDYDFPETEQQTAIPPAAARIPQPDEVINVLLLGTDQRPKADPTFLTDTVIIVSINTEENTVNMLSIPRDTLVYAPTWGMWKINQVYAKGEAIGWRGGGFGFMADTLEYNFGVHIDYYALVDMTSFRDVVDAMGGVEIPVDCAISGVALAPPYPHPDDFPSYEAWAFYTDPEENPEHYIDFTIRVGVQELDGYETLWYARQRKGSSDFDRAYRQQQVLRAILHKAQELGITNLTNLPQWYRQYSDLVQTNMGLGNFFEFAPVASNLDDVAINSYILLPGTHLVAWPDPKIGQIAYLPIQGAVQQTFTFAMRPPSKNYIISNTTSVEIRNGTGFARLDEVAADRLLNNGLDATPTGFADAQTYSETVIYDFTGDVRSENVRRLQELLRVGEDNIIVNPDPNRTFDYVVILGDNYRACDRNVRGN